MGGGDVMDYVWRDYRSDLCYRIDSDGTESSPPLEISRRTGMTVVVNPRPRFSVLFRALWQVLRGANAKDAQALTNVLLHFLAQLDRLTGLSTGLVRKDELHRSLTEGYFGAQVQRTYGNLEPMRQQMIVSFLRKQEEEDGRRLYFREAVKAIFPRSFLYFYHPDQIFLIYLPQAENAADEDCMQLLRMLFLDVTAQMQLYWKYPFGIIGRNAMMRMNHMKLYGEGKGA